MDRDDQLHAMCHKYNDHLSKPVWVDISGDMYKVACDGHLVVFLSPELLGEDPPCPDDLPSYTLSSFEKFCGEVVPDSAVLTTTQAILAWSGSGEPEYPQCAECGGTGEVPDKGACAHCEGQGEIECECHCGDTHHRDCSDCDGTGDGEAVPGAMEQCEVCRGSGQGNPAIEPGRIVDATLNRVLLARIISVVGEGECLVWAPDLGEIPRISLRGDGWRATLMGLRDSVPTCEPFKP